MIGIEELTYLPPPREANTRRMAEAYIARAVQAMIICGKVHQCDCRVVGYETVERYLTLAVGEIKKLSTEDDLGEGTFVAPKAPIRVRTKVIHAISYGVGIVIFVSLIWLTWIEKMGDVEAAKTSHLRWHGHGDGCRDMLVC